MEANKITGFGLDTPSIPKSQKEFFKRLQKIYVWNHHITIDDTNAMFKAVQLKVQSQRTRYLNYIEQDFFRTTVMPANSTAFCLASTRDTLPSLANLKRWKITTESMGTLCTL